MIRAISGIGDSIVFKSGVPVSVVCVAATFTGVTYANNGGKVQLVSTGVHGLTTSPAVGASVYVSWAGGTGVSGLYNVLSVDDTLKFTVDLTYAVGLGTPTVAVAGTEISIASINLPILMPGAKICATAPMTLTNSANNKFFRAKINGVLIGGSVATTLKDYHWLLEISYYASNQKISNNYLPYGGSSSSGAYTYASIDTTTTNIFTLHAMAAAANEVITYQSYRIEVFV